MEYSWYISKKVNQAAGVQSLTGILIHGDRPHIFPWERPRSWVFPGWDNCTTV